MNGVVTEREWVSHRPAGSGHPYRYDLDQRVPFHPVVDEAFEVRVLAAAEVESVTIRVEAAGIEREVVAERVAGDELVCEIGPFPARPAESGHLAAAAASSLHDADSVVWRAMITLAAPALYRVIARRAGSEQVGGAHPVEPISWTVDGGTLGVSGGAASRLVPGSVEWASTASGPVRVRFRLRLDDGQHIIGLGERYATLDHRGEVLDAVVFEQYKQQGRRTYLPVPMAVVVGGEHWGFHIVTSRRTWFDLGAADRDAIVVVAEVDPAAPTLRVDLLAGPPHAVVHEFLERTGKPPVPPDWIFEPWMSGNEWNTQQRVELEVGRSLAERVPVGVVVIEAWSDESTFVAFRDARYEIHPDGAPHRLADFTFPADGAWPDPVRMVQRLRDRGVRVLLWQIPLIPTDRGEDGQVAADAAALVDRGLCVREADGSPHRNRGWWFPGALIPDFTDPAARRWWRDRRRYLLEEVGIAGFKTDGGEHLWGHDLRFADGTTGAETNNRFPVLFGQTYHELLRDVGVEGITFSRSGFTGSSAFPGHWAGDDDSTWNGIAAAIRAGLSAGVAGIWFWGWDLGGFSGPIPDAELYLRAAAVATFCPIMQYHAEFNHHRLPSNDRTPWNIAEQTGDEWVIDVYRAFAELRMRLVPYLAEQTLRSIGSGRPLMRPLCFDHPDDDRTWAYPLQFQLGDDLLVTPVTTPATEEIEVYLPAGTWIDPHDGTTHVGPAVFRHRIPIDRLPIFRREGGSSCLDGVFSTPSATSRWSVPGPIASLGGR